MRDFATDEDVDSLIFTIVSETHDEIVDCEIDSNPDMDCTTQTDKNGDSEVTLEVEDNNYQPGFLQYTLGVIPKNYTFYFDHQKLTLERPGGGKEMVKASLGKLNQVQDVNYFLEESIIIQRCQWNATILLEKPWFTLLQKIIIILYNNTGQEISNNEEDFGLNILWTKKILQLNGSIHKKDEFKSIKLIVQGFSFWKNIGILYGDDNPSQIYFDFGNK